MASIKQRNSGLVQRRTEAIRSAADKDRDSAEEEDEARRGEEEDDDEKRDSKETRLTLMEEVLLLGLKDREVGAVSLTRQQGSRATRTQRNVYFASPTVY